MWITLHPRVQRGTCRRRRGVSTVVPPTKARMAPMRAAGAIAASLATATAAVTVLVYSVALARDDLGLDAEDQVPAWVRLAELAAIAVMVLGTWAVRVDHPRA